MENKHKIDFRYSPSSCWTNIGLKDDTYKTLVREDGALLYDFQEESILGYFKRVYEFGIIAAHKPISVKQVTESPRFACVVTTIDYAKATLELRTFAHFKDGQRTDVVLWTLRAHDDVPAYLTEFTINVYENGKNFICPSSAPSQVIFSVSVDQKPKYEFPSAANDLEVGEKTQPASGDVTFLSVPYPLIATISDGFRPCSALGTEPMVIHAGEKLCGAIILPQNYHETMDFDYAWAEQAYAESKAYWENLQLFNIPIHIPDESVMMMLEACARNILQAREIKDGLPVFQVGATIYRNLWVVDGHFLLEAAHYMGFHDEAFNGVNTLLKRVKSDGSITEIPYHTKETGISLLTLVRQCELMGDDERLRSLWPIVCNGVSFIEGLRKEANELHPNSPCYQLLPASFGDGGLGGQRGEYTTVFWILVGLKAVADAAARLGFRDDATRFQKDFDSLLSDFRRHAARDMKTLSDGAPYLPMCKPGSGEHTFISDYPFPVPEYAHLSPSSATWAICHAIYPGEVFLPEDEMVNNLLHLYDLMDNQEGVPESTGWIPYHALWNYNASFAAHVWLYAGRGEKAVDYLYAFANHASPTRVWREEQSLIDSEEGQLIGDMPHNWASAEFIRLVRHMVVFERGNTIELLAGIPLEWCNPGDVIAFERTPTRFGPLTLRLETDQDWNFVLNVERDLTWQQQPGQVKVYLPAKDVKVNGKSTPGDNTNWYLLANEEKVQVCGSWKPENGDRTAK